MNTISGENLYELNKMILKTDDSATMEEQDYSLIVKEAVKHIKDGLQSAGHAYYMFLCRERYDITVFNITGKAKEERIYNAVLSLAKSRGKILSVNYDAVMKGYEFWIEDELTEEVFMYVLFNCNDFIIEIGGR